MYTPTHFNETDPETVQAIIDAYPLAALVANLAHGFEVNHLPLLRAPNGDLIGHIAKANDLHRHAMPNHEVLAIFTAEDAYVSANDYPSKPRHHRHVPTWNYRVVHVHGTMSFQHDTPSKRAAVALLTRVHERRVHGEGAWKMSDAPTDYIDQMLDNIVAFKITPTRIDAKSKLSQNRENEDRIGAATALAARGKDEIARLILQKAQET